jgi:succinate dehydrogenase / fumarate reductase, cytochrome b subunit
MMIYRWHLGYVAWLLNRITGIAIAFYLAIHIWVIHHLTQGPAGFNKVMNFVQQPLFKLGEIGLLGVILYHAMNGLRILCIEWGSGYRIQKRLFWWVMAIGVVLFIFGAYPIFVSALQGGAELGEVVR